MAFQGLTMAPAAKAAWCAALRSGEYKQEQTVLQVMDGYTGKPMGFCCLGVLLDINGMVGEPVWLDSRYGPTFTGVCNYAMPAGAGRTKFSKGLPTNEWMSQHFSYQQEIKGVTFLYAVGSLITMVSDMNDNGKSFAEIADWIDANL